MDTKYNIAKREPVMKYKFSRKSNVLLKTITVLSLCLLLIPIVSKSETITTDFRKAGSCSRIVEILDQVQRDKNIFDIEVSSKNLNSSSEINCFILFKATAN